MTCVEKDEIAERRGKKNWQETVSALKEGVGADRDGKKAADADCSAGKDELYLKCREDLVQKRSLSLFISGS